MAIIGDALRQVFMSKHEYESLREEEKAWGKLQKPLLVGILTSICIAVSISVYISLNIVFPGNKRRPFCGKRRIQPLPINARGDSDLFPGAFYLTDQETVDYYWMVVFTPSMIVFFASAVYLIAGVAVAYTAPARHGCIRVVENNYCTSKRAFLGSSLLTLGNSCAVPLFWCYEIASWGIVILYGGTAFLLRRKAAVILDLGDFSGRNIGLEMLEANPVEVTPEVERRVNEGFKAWMGSSLLSSDEEEDETDDYHEVPHINSNWQRD